MSDVGRRNLLSSCIVDAGSEGVNIAVEQHGLIASDIVKHYGKPLARLSRITLYDVADRVLGGFEKGLAE